jgi:hypothetical protein
VSLGISGIIGILFTIALVTGLGVWVLYAYRNPHTASGQLLIRVSPLCGHACTKLYSLQHSRLMKFHFDGDGMQCNYLIWSICVCEEIHILCAHDKCLPFVLRI